MRISDWSSDVCSSDLVHRHGLEKAEVLHALARAAQLGGVEGIAFDKLELAADHPVERAHVALDIDALDEDLGAFLDVVDDVDGQVVAVALDARADVDEGIAKNADGVGERLDGLVDLPGVVPVAFLGGDMLAQGIRIELAQAGLQAAIAALEAQLGRA